MAAEEQKVIFSMVRVSRIHGTKQVLRDISLGFFYGAKIGVLGLNGSGKSTLLRIMAGLDESSTARSCGAGIHGRAARAGAAARSGKTVLEIVGRARQSRRHCSTSIDRMAEPSPSPWTTTRCRGCSSAGRGPGTHRGGRRLGARLPPRAGDGRLALPARRHLGRVLSGGERRRVALCRLLIQQPEILLLDEPTNHLDAESVAWLERHLKEYPGTVIAVTHDRYFLDNVAGWILELDRGHGIPWKGNYSSWLEQKQERLRQEEKARASASEPSSASWSGSGWPRAPATPRARPGSTPIRSCCRRSRRRWCGTSRS